MTDVWTLAALWLGLALIATLLAIWFRVSTALTEILVGTAAQFILGGLIPILRLSDLRLPNRGGRWT